jgi:cytochrome c2
VLAMGVLTYKGAVAKEALASENEAAVPSWIKKNHLSANAQPGARLFAQLPCLSCHTYLGSGSSNLGAPDLSSIGKGQTVSFFQQYVADPTKFGNSVMPKFDQLGQDNLHKIALFLAASKGG